MKYKMIIVMVLSLVVLVNCGGNETKTSEKQEKAADKMEMSAMDPATAATITGKIEFKGTPPKERPIKMGAEKKCEALHTKRVFPGKVLVNDNGTLQNVFVYIKEGLDGRTFDPPEEPVTIDQIGCRYTPHVFGIQVNQPLQILNSDPFLHNIHALPKKSREFNFGMPNVGERRRTITEKEVMVKVKCDVHPWMKAYIGVLDHPYYSVTGADGSFNLSNVPPGNYVVEAWHETYNTQVLSVTVGESETKEITFTFGPDAEASQVSLK